MNFALALASNRLPGIHADWTQPQPSTNAAPDETPTPESEEIRLEGQILPGGASPTTRAAALKEFASQSAQNNNWQNAQDDPSFRAVFAARRISRAPNATAVERQDQILAGLLIGSPDFQRR